MTGVLCGRIEESVIFWRTSRRRSAPPPPGLPWVTPSGFLGDFLIPGAYSGPFTARKCL